ncbi:MAG: squalene/phytoene synthase family protein [Hyphomicrobiaceae bacterium]|nr:squalene/phytoene synthase family protein [Hyphomicrobiaceae bacterium]
MTETATADAAPSPEDVVRLSARASERDRYLAALLAPRQVRQALVALAAFAGEVGRIPAFVSEPMVGEIRLQWWREALENADPALRSGHPVADAMRATAAQHELPLGLLIGFIDAQSAGLYDEPMTDDQSLAAHLAKTEGALFELALRILGGRDEAARAAAYAAGQAYGLARLLVELPALWAQGRSLIPVSRLAAAGLTLADIRAGLHTERLAPVLAGLAGEARLHLAEARRLDRSLAPAQHAAILPLAVVEPYLRAFERARRDPLRDPLELLPARRVWALWRSRWSGRF